MVELEATRALPRSIYKLFNILDGEPCFISCGNRVPRLVISTGEKPLVWPLRMNLRNSKICILFTMLISLANSGKGTSTGMLKTKNLLAIFSYMTLAVTWTPRNLVIRHTSIAQSTSVVLKIKLPDLVYLTLAIFDAWATLIFSFCLRKSRIFSWNSFRVHTI